MLTMQPQEIAEADRPIAGSEPLSAEESEIPLEHLPLGYTMDETGLLNNYAILPKITEEDPATAESQRRIVNTIFTAMFMVVVMVLIAVTVSL
ncbi:ssl1498 family light-harvesting-like protein [Tumidithrix elongata RA019]|uniref:Ssl1498 family light-harvesting-like protein n=1 Tax=Tumidithrix elongata BACA0141 TaxID=2716417 RepID=A0AAW9Q1A6_9CYAN|nr:ssl1498 family light-harvesting-like protein [Tumidithrix elongata RA019]